MATRYFIGKGKVYFAEKDSLTGQPLGFQWLGNVPRLSLNTNQTRVEHQESYTGKNLTDKVVTGPISADASFTVEEMTKENLTRFLYGSTTIISPATITNEDVTARLGQSIALTRSNLTSFTSLVLASAPATVYVAGADYQVDLKAGMIFFPTTSSIANNAALRANYAAGGMEKVSAFTGNVNKDYWLRFAGLNQAEDDAPCIIDIYKFRPDPVGSMELINEGFNQIDIQGMAQYEEKMADTAADGRFFRIQITPDS